MIDFSVTTKAQRRAILAHLDAWILAVPDLPIAHKLRAALGRMSIRVLAGMPTMGPDSDITILRAAVYLRGTDRISVREAQTLGRAWSNLGWAEGIPIGDPVESDRLAKEAETKILALWNPPAR